jgi:uncharacterized membrane protein YphA (DoxX/SURF4 family)
MKKIFPLSQENATFLIRIGLGLIMLSGGLAKLSKLLNPDAQAAMVGSYTGPSGYINPFFMDFLFQGGWLSPWFFLTSLSSFELLVGICLIIGFAVGPLSLLMGLLFWSFVVSLPVVTAAGVTVSVKTYTSPAMLIMIRDIALSGMLFTLYNLGSGPMSLDGKLFGCPALRKKVNWDNLGLLLRLSIGVVFLVGGVFYGMDHIKSFVTPWILIPIGLVLISGNGVKIAGYAAAIVIAWYMLTKLNLEKSLIGNMNGIKREFGLLAGAIVLSQFGGGNLFTVSGKWNKWSSFVKRGFKYEP